MDYMSIKNQTILREFVRRNVIYCVSGLIAELMHVDDNYYEELAVVCSTIDWETTCENNGINVYYNDAMEKYVFADKDGDESEVYDTLNEAQQAACLYYDLDWGYKEAYEHWLVDRWFGEQLDAHGEMVIFDFLGLECIWGRTCTGQAILLDHVIGEIAEEMEILENQKHEWVV